MCVRFTIELHRIGLGALLSVARIPVEKGFRANHHKGKDCCWSGKARHEPRAKRQETENNSERTEKRQEKRNEERKKDKH